MSFLPSFKPKSRNRTSSSSSDISTMISNVFRPSLREVPEEKIKNREFKDTADSGSSCSSLNERPDSNEDGFNGSIGRKRGLMKTGQYSVARRNNILVTSPSTFQIINGQTLTSSPRTSVSADAVAIDQERLIELMRQYDVDNIDDNVANEMLNLAMSCEKMTSEAREEMGKKPKELKLKYVQYVYGGLVTEPGIETDKMTPKTYVDYINTATSDIIKSFSMTRGAQALGYVNNLARSISLHIISSNHQPSAKTSATNNFKQNFAEIREVILQLRVDCSRQSLSWLVHFIELGGLKALFLLLDTIHKKPDKYVIRFIIRKAKHHEVEAEVLKVMKIIANHERGIEELLSEPSSLNILIMSINSPNLPTRTNSIDFLLGVVTIDYPQGHKLVMSALNYLKVQMNETFLFETLVKSIKELVDQQGVWGTSVGSKKSSNRVFVADHGYEKGGNTLHREIKEFLESFFLT